MGPIHKGDGEMKGLLAKTAIQAATHLFSSLIQRSRPQTCAIDSGSRGLLTLFHHSFWVIQIKATLHPASMFGNRSRGVCIEILGPKFRIGLDVAMDFEIR